MAKCEICDKSRLTGKKLSITRSHISRRTNRAWKPNIKKIKIDDNGTIRTIHICTRCLRSNKVKRAV